MSHESRLLPQDSAVPFAYPGDNGEHPIEATHEAAHRLMRWIWSDNSGARRGVTTRFYAALYLVEHRYCQTHTVAAFARMAGVRRQVLERQVDRLRLAAMNAEDIKRLKASRHRA